MCESYYHVRALPRGLEKLKVYLHSTTRPSSYVLGQIYLHLIWNYVVVFSIKSDEIVMCLMSALPQFRFYNL
jgi:hypothetical protein